MRVLAVLILLFICGVLVAQHPSDAERILFSKIKAGNVLPPSILKSRSIVFFSHVMKEKELSQIQLLFQEAGIDPVAYFDTEKLIAGTDATRAFTNYLIKRDVANLIFLQKNGDYSITIVPFNNKETLIDQDQTGWTASDKSLSELLKTVYRVASTSYKKENFLIHEVPEMDIVIESILGRRAEAYAIDLKIDPLAVPKFGVEELDKKLEEIMKSYPYKYTLVDASIPERDLRRQGYFYVLRFVHARGAIAKEILGYDTSQAESALASVTYGSSGELVKMISAEQRVFKFYFKHIDSGNVFLGTKWDADMTWEDALANQINGFKRELRIN